jgi:hypothetical protein
MITDEQILQIAREHLYVLTSVNEWCGEEGDLLNFARAIYEIAYNEGHDEGWESREEAEYFNSSYPTGLVGDPQ